MNVLAVSAAEAGPGVVAFLVVAAIGVALYLLIKSMNRHLNKIDLPREADVRKAEREERRAARAAAKRAAGQTGDASGTPGDADDTGGTGGPHGADGPQGEDGQDGDGVDGTAGDRPKKTNGAPRA